ncbi:MAG TPA: NHL repeat-containing protein, partial [Solirubrobacteraceae bacterium]|nr:NHL repeat-containing protein [Solirubrobacteraceae bacterium]
MRRIFLAPACATAIVLLLCSASALAARGHVCNNTFGTLGSGNGQLNDPQGVALNEATGRIYVVDKANNRVEYFSAAGAYEGQFNGSGAPQQFLEPQAIAVDNSLSSSKGNVYVADVGNRVVDKLGPGGEYIGQVSATKTALFNEIMGVAVNPSGELWVAFNYGASDYVSRFSSDLSKVNNEWKPRGGGFIKPAIAVDAQDNLYISREIGAGRIEKTNASGETLNPEVGGERDYYWPAVETSTGDSFLGQLDHVSVFSPEGVPIEHLGQGRLTVAAGIAVNSASGTVYIADSSADGVVVCPFEPPGPPTIESDSVSEVSATGATFGGELNPRSLGGEPATEYAFEYGSCPTIEQCPASPYEELALESLAASFEVSSVGVRLQVLQPDTAYHVRLVARNSHSPGQGFVVGSEVTFTTQRVGGPLALPDGRSWELVTPPDAHGAALFPIGGEGLVQAASDGSGIAYLASYPVEPGAQGFAVLAQVLARRGAAGWSSTDVMVSHDTPTGVTVGNGHEYRFFSEDLAAAIVEPLGPFSPPMSEGLLEASPEPTERTPYLRHDTTCQTTPATCYEPLVVGGEEGDVSPSGTKFGGSAATSVVGLAKFAGATPDAAHVIVSSSVGLTEHPSAPGGGLYGWSAASPGGERLGLVSVLPKEEGGQAAPVYELGGGSVARHAISNDGSRVVFTARPPGEGPHLYVRDMVKRQTIRLDVPEAGMPAGAEGVFQTASVDGSKVFFTNVSSLVKGAGLDDLYECELVEVEQAAENKLKCVLSDLTPIPAAGQPGAGQPAEVQGVLGASEDGGYVYFVANGVQAPGATPGNCAGTSTPKEGETCNLYVRHAGATSFIATLSQEDSPDWTAETSREASRVSPDGEWLAFMSDRSLTGYDNRDAKSGRPDEE